MRVVLLALATAFLLTALFTGLETVGLNEEPSLIDFALDYTENLILVAAIFASVLMLPRLRDLESKTESLRRDVSATNAAGAEWRSRAQATLLSLSDAIEDQFATWELTTAERDVAGLILKGMSLKDIALARDTSEATIRQQAQSVYRKAGLTGRAELSAYFLEDLFNVRETVMMGSQDGRNNATSH